MKRITVFGWFALIQGLLFIALAVYTFSNPLSAIVGLVALFALAALFSGLTDLLFGFGVNRHTGIGRGTVIVVGILKMVIGILIILNLGTGAYLFTLLFPIWFLVHSVAWLANLGYIKLFAHRAVYWTTMILNIAGLVIGMLLLLNPVASILSVNFMVGLDLFTLGISSIVIAFSGVSKTDAQHDEAGHLS